MNNVSVQEFPQALIKAIQRQENIFKIFYLSKGASECLYVISYKEKEKEHFKIVCYGETKITTFLEEIFSTPTEERTFYQKSSLQKLALFTKTLFEDYNLESIEIAGLKLSFEGIDDFFNQSHSSP